MQVTEANADGLKRTIKVVVGAGELGQRYESRLGEIKDSVQLKGFRKGKVPVTHLKKVYGRSVMAEVLQEAVTETSRQVITDRNERPAFQPKIELAEEPGAIDRVIAGAGDLAYTMSFEILPKVALTDLSAIHLTRPVAEVTDEAIDKAIATLVERGKTFEPKDDHVAAEGDRLTVDFVGRIDGEAFEGGAAEGVNVVLGQSTFIPGFEDGLKGAKAGEERLVKASFPADYGAKHLAGKDAVFEAKVKEVAVARKPEVDDAFAKTMGADSLSDLRTKVADQIKKEYGQVSRGKLKRALLDALDKAHTFELPPTLVDNEFEGIWGQVTQSLKQAGKTLEDEGKSEDDAKAEYRKIAERRVRLGLVLAEIGESNTITVNDEELQRGIFAQARRYPGQERMVVDYYTKSPEALAELRAPIFEDKVVDFAIELVKVADKTVSRDELLKEDEDPEI